MPRDSVKNSSEPYFAVLGYCALGDLVNFLPAIRYGARRLGMKALLLTKHGWMGRVLEGVEYIGGSISLGGRMFRCPLINRLSPAVAYLRERKPEKVYVTNTISDRKRRAVELLKFAGVEPGRIVFGPPDWHQPEFRQAGFEPTLADSEPPVLRATDGELAAIRERLRREAGWQGEPIVLITMGSYRTSRWIVTPGKLRRTPKWWGFEKWGSVIEGVRQSLPAALIILTGTSSESFLNREIVRRFRKRDSRLLSWANKTSIRELIALQSISHSAISTDTGTAHTAMAAGCPIVILYANADPRVKPYCYPLGWGPVAAIRGTSNSLAGIEDFNMRKIQPETVLRAWSELPARPPEPPKLCHVMHYLEGGGDPERLETRLRRGVPAAQC